MKYLYTLAFMLPALFYGCTKTSDPEFVLAEYTLGNGGNCTGATVSGRFVADTALAGANTVAVTVDVKVAGAYWISTNMVNGISFSQISTFTSTGPQIALLTGTGTPVDTGTVNFTLAALNGQGDSCKFSVTTVQGIAPHYYLTCFFNGNYKNFSDSATATNSNIPGTSGSTGLDISGLDTLVNSTSKIDFGVGSPGSIGPGIYTDTTANYTYFKYVDSIAQTWTVSNSGQPTFTVVVTGVSARSVQGSFSGTIKMLQGNVLDSIAVTNGLFSVPLK
ncbi:MAG: hypothetical protein ABIN25_04065 [Ginsengibacter sp.]